MKSDIAQYKDMDSATLSGDMPDRIRFTTISERITATSAEKAMDG